MNRQLRSSGTTNSQKKWSAQSVGYYFGPGRKNMNRELRNSGTANSQKKCSAQGHARYLVPCANTRLRHSAAMKRLKAAKSADAHKELRGITPSRLLQEGVEADLREQTRK